MDPFSMSTTIAMPGYIVSFNNSLMLNSVQTNLSRSTLIRILTQTTAHVPVGNKNGDSSGGSSDDEDLFGEHYFHICIYIWACVVVSSLIALSVLHLSLQKWGCCGRSLTRWEVKRIPLKRFQKTDGDDCQDKCPICHEEFSEGRLIRQLPCNHCYHSYCVDRWLVKMSNRCPLCKQRVSISLFCPWNKHQKKKEIHGLINAEAEASIDESLPLPPLSTLTPQNWYGEDIMSGPSKFIIMRPGRPTRVIDVREQKKKAKAEQEAKALAKKQNEAAALANAGSSNVSEALDEVQSLLIPSSPHESPSEDAGVCAAETLMMVCRRISKDDNYSLKVHAPLLKSSRSCSFSCEQPLLMETECPTGIEADLHLASHIDHPAFREPRFKNRNIPQKHAHGNTQCTGVHYEPAESTVTLNSRSSSVVSVTQKSVSLAQTFDLGSSLPLPCGSSRNEVVYKSADCKDLPSRSAPVKHRTWPENLNQASAELTELCVKGDPTWHKRHLHLSTDDKVFS
ncbi:hypothetical protein Btru_032898 [Bulinus truncatus]|nr:hypothetical protein Btru_032898 [Bulinus truncatus]